MVATQCTILISKATVGAADSTIDSSCCQRSTVRIVCYQFRPYVMCAADNRERSVKVHLH